LKGVAIGNGLENQLIGTTEYLIMKAAFTSCEILLLMHFPLVDEVVCNTLYQITVGNNRFNVYDIREKCEIPPLCYNFSAIENYL
jgi:hypothetical protein